MAFVHSRFVIASVPQTSLEISLLFPVVAFRCPFDALVAGSSCRSINKKGSFVNSYVDTMLCVWIWTWQTIFLKRQIHYVFALLELDLQEVGGGCGDWMELAQDRDRWRELVSTVMNLRVPKMRGIS